MVEIIRNTPFRLVFILVPAMFVLFRGVKSRLDRDFLMYILLIALTEIFTLFHEGYNLVHYSIFSIIHIGFFSYIVYKETRKRIIFAIGLGPTTASLIFFLFTDFSSINLLKITNVFPVRNPLDTQQYFDYSAIINLCFVVITFIWLYQIISVSCQRDGGLTKRFIYIFGFLGYFCGSFFTVAFGRYIIGDTNLWFEYWNKIYLPLYLLFMLTLNIGLLWKPTPSSSS